MKTSALKIIFTAIFMASLISCEKEMPLNQEVNPEAPKVNIENNTLVFTDWDAYTSYSDYVLGLEEIERAEFEQTIGFRSMATELEELYVSLTDLDKDETEKAVANNNDIVKFENNIIRSRVFSQAYKTIINREGKVIVNGSTIIVSESSFKEFKNGEMVNQKDFDNASVNNVQLKGTGGTWIKPYYFASGQTQKYMGNGVFVNLDFYMRTVFIPEKINCCSQYTFCQKVEYGSHAYLKHNGAPVALKHRVWDTYGNVQAFFKSGNGSPVLQRVYFSIPNKTQNNLNYSIYNSVDIGGVDIYNYAPSTKLQFYTVNGKAGAIGYSESAVISLSGLKQIDTLY